MQSSSLEMEYFWGIQEKIEADNWTQKINEKNEILVEQTEKSENNFKKNKLNTSDQ